MARINENIAFTIIDSHEKNQKDYQLLFSQFKRMKKKIEAVFLLLF